MNADDLFKGGDLVVPSTTEPTGQGEPTPPTGEAQPVEPQEQPTTQEPVEPQGQGAQPPTEPLTPTPTTTEPQPPVYTDQDVLAYVREKLGIDELSDFEQLRQKPIPELDPQLQAIQNWKNETNREDIRDWFKFQQDYDSLSDIDVVKEYLRTVKYPNITEENMKFELESYLPHEDDLDTEAARKSWNLQKLALDARQELGKYKTQFNQPVDVASKLPSDLQNYIKVGKEYEANLAKSQEANKQYQASINSAISTIENIDLNLGNGQNIKFNISDEIRSALPEAMSNMAHWYNADGSYNHQAVVQDAIKVQYFDQALAAAFEQGKSVGTEQVLNQAGNSTQTNTQTNVDPKTNGGQGKIVVEGLDNYLGKPYYGRRK